MNKRIALILFFCITLSTTVVFAAPSDIQRHWAGTEINTLLQKGVINGYPDGSFRPDSSITREEVTSILASFIKERESDYEEPYKFDVGVMNVEEGAHQDSHFGFTDLESHRWSFRPIVFLTEKKIISGYPNGTFKPRGTLTRGEFASLIYNYLKVYDWDRKDNTNDDKEDPVFSTNTNFSDISNSFAYEKIIELNNRMILGGYGDGSFRPENSVTRGEVAATLFKLSGWTALAPVVEIPEIITIDVPYISQLHPVYAVVGCEGTALLSGLHGKGYAKDVGLKEFLDAMPKHASNPAKGFVGSPYVADKTKKSRTTIYPSKLAEYAKKYGNVVDISGSSPKEIRGEIAMGNPVVAYVTMWWEKPFYRDYDIEGSYKSLLSNNHAVLVCGYDYRNGKYYISDPYNSKMLGKEYKYWVDGETFERIYNERRHAIAVR